MLKKGFTLIELLIVIAVLGILAVAVLAAINPIEQINRSRDTGSRSDSEQLISAVDRFYASRGYYPWVTSASVTDDSLIWTAVGSAWTNGTTGVLNQLSSAGTEEVKASFTNRVTASGYNTLYVYKSAGNGTTMYICFKPKSGAFQRDSADRCTAGFPVDLPKTPTGGPNLCAASAEWSCLP